MSSEGYTVQFCPIGVYTNVEVKSLIMNEYIAYCGLDCDSLCPIRQCTREKQMETCGVCPEMESGEKVGAILGNNPDGRGRLKTAGSV